MTVMNKTIWVIVLLLLLTTGGVIVWRNTYQAPEPFSTDINDNAMTNETVFRLTSPTFTHNGVIPTQFTCDGDNINPPLSISGIPEETQSLALLVDDPDIPSEIKESRGIDVFDHWVVFNISPDASDIPQDASGLGIEGQNSSGELGYAGPCPPTEYQPTEHRYFFRVYALDTELALSEGATKEEVEKAMEGHIIAQTETVGRYDRSK
jgi:hypothetical protein